MASTTQEIIAPNYADPSYFVFAERAARMKQEQKIVPGMAWKLFNGAIPEASFPKIAKREAPEEIISPKAPSAICDDQGVEMNFQDPWEGLREIRNYTRVKRPAIDTFKSMGAELDVSCFFYGY